MTPAFISAEVCPVGGRLKVFPEDFEVAEVPLYEPCQEGPHRYIEVTKVGWTTESLRRKVAKELGRNSRDVGYAGLKDRHAVTVQRYSFPDDWDGVLPLLQSLDGVLEAVDLGQHRNKLRRGHLRGNRFQIVVREVNRHGLDRARQVEKVLNKRGWPNYFGAQRFGGDGGNAELGRRLVKGERVKVRRFERDLMVSAYQSLLFNRYLEQRVNDGFFDRVLLGDICAHLPGGGFFEVDDPDSELERLLAFEISSTGPIFGCKARLAEGEPGAWERRLLASEELATTDFSAPGSRRRLRLPLQEFSVEADGENLRFKFFLPAGSYATVLLDEFMKTGG